MDERERYRKGRQRCATCVYRSGAAVPNKKSLSDWSCDYIAITGHPRSAICKPGLDCTVYKRGTRLPVAMGPGVTG